MPNPTQADVVGSAALRVGGMGTLGAASDAKLFTGPNKIKLIVQTLKSQKRFE